MRIEFSNYVTTGTYGTLIDDINLSINAQSAVLALKPTKNIVRVVDNTNTGFNVYPNPDTRTIN